MTRSRVTVLLPVLGLLLAACASTSTPVATGAAEAALPGGTVTVRITGDWKHIDPQHPTVNAGNQTNAIIRSFYDTLIAVGPDGKLVPYLAKSWEQTSASIKFVLRDDATCADGTKVTPTVVKNSWERGVKGQGARTVLGPGPYSLSADDAAGTFTWATRTPASDAIFSFTTGAIICPAGLANPDALQTAPQGSGPYLMEEAVQGDHFTVKLRPDWKWGPVGFTAKSPGLPERIIFRVVTNETTAANLLLTGGLDLGLVTGLDVDRLLNEKTLTNKAAIGPLAWTLSFNHSADRPTADTRVREALSSAVDRKAWNRVAYQDRGLITSGFIAPSADCADPTIEKYMPTGPGPDKAKQVLTAAGWTLVNGKFQKSGKPLVVNFLATTSGVGSGPDYLASTWESAGISVKYDLLDFNGWLQRLIKSDFDVLIIQNSSESPGPTIGAAQFLGTVPPAGYNWGKTVNPEAESEFKLAQTTIGNERCQHWSNVQRLMLQSFNILPLTAPATQWFSRGLDFRPGVTTIDVRYIKRVKS